MIGDLAATFVKLCHVLCNFSAIVIFEVAVWLQALLDRGLRRFGTSKMHLSPPVAWAAVRSKAVVLLLLTFLFIVTPIVGVCNCSMFCCTLLCVCSCIAIILMGKRELVTLLNLSSWCLVMVERFFLTVPPGCLRFVIVVFPDHTHLLFYILRMAREKTTQQVCTFDESILQ